MASDLIKLFADLLAKADLGLPYIPRERNQEVRI